VAPKPQQIHYCDVCKISCAGPQTYREHLEGQKHKKREALLKQQKETAAAASRGANCLHCELCDVTCTGNDAYAAHVRGAKHQKVVKLHTKLGKPIPSADPTPVPVKKEGDENGAEDPDHISNEDIKPVGEDYIEEIKDNEGKIVTFNCKLCECKFNDPNAKEMHMKGRRHRLQFKKKVQPDLVVDVKPTLRQRKMAEREKQRAAMQEEYWNRRRMAEAEMDDEDRMYWDGYGWHGNFPMRGRGPAPLMGGFPYFNMMNARRIETADDRHVVARHAEIYPKEEELQTIQRIVSHTERALKLVSDAMTETKPATTESTPAVPQAEAAAPVQADGDQKDGENKDSKDSKGENGNMISFQKDTEGTVRLLKGVMRVGLLAKGLLLQGDNTVQLVVLCAEKPTSTMLKRVVTELPIQLKKVAEDHKYTVQMAPVEGAVNVSDGAITVKVSLTSPLLREQQGKSFDSIITVWFIPWKDWL
jgi:zinc finger RNA-binding protein